MATADHPAMEAHAAQLLSLGYAVIPVLSPKYGRKVIRRLHRDMGEYPEYRDPSPSQTQFVMGGFGALGNPASFHSQTVRKLRVVLDHQATLLFRSFVRALHRPDPPSAPQYSLEQLFDRVCVRRAGTRLTSESWHRDVTPAQIRLPRADSATGELDTAATQLNRGTVFGGWLNLDLDQTQHFSCAPATHRVDPARDGFALIPPDQHPAMAEKQVKVAVPPGHWIVFYQHIAHQVCPKTSPRDSFRLFASFNLVQSDSPAPLFGIDYMSRVVEFQDAVLLPSGQRPPLFAAQNLSYHRDRVAAWSAATFLPSLLVEHTTGPKTKNPGLRYKTVPRFLTRTTLHRSARARRHKYSLPEIAAIVPKLLPQ